MGIVTGLRALRTGSPLTTSLSTNKQLLLAWHNTFWLHPLTGAGDGNRTRVISLEG